jgi:hypothetical protein
MNKQTKTKTNKQINTHTKKNSRFRNNRISVLVVLMLLFQHPVLVLVFKQRLSLSLVRWLGNLASFSSVFQWQLLSQLLPQRRVACPQVLVISSVAHQHPALELGFCCVGLLGASYFAMPPFSGTKSVFCLLAPAVSVLWWLADCFSILSCCLTLDVAHWLRRWILWTSTCPISGSSLPPTRCQPFCLSSLCLLKVGVEISSLLFPLLQWTYSTLPLCCVLLFSSLFIQTFFSFVFFCRVGYSLLWGYAGLSQGWLGEYHVTLGAHLLVC